MNGILVPVKFVKWCLPWKTEDGNIQEIIIDSAGHFKMLRCCTIIVMIAAAFEIYQVTGRLPPHAQGFARKRFMVPWVNVAEFVANITV